MAGLQPIHLKIKELAIKAALRLKLNNRWFSNYEPDSRPSYISHAQSIDKSLSQVTVFTGILSDWIPMVMSLDRNFTVSIKPREEVAEYIASLPPSTWQVYTDGSKQDDLTGAGVCVYQNSHEIYRNSYNLGKYPTVYQCEVFALHMGSIWAKTNILSKGTIIFLTDSTATIKAISSNEITSRLVLDTIQSLNSLGSTHQVEITWVPGHSNHKGNELADEEAGRGSGIAPIGPEPFLPVSKRVNDNIISDFMYSLHLKSYTNLNISPKGKTPLTIWLQAHRYNPPIASGIHLKWLTWLLSGHSPLAYFQHKCGTLVSPDCPHCPGIPETSAHYLAECTHYANIRLKYLGFIMTSIEKILDRKTRNILDYITATGRFDESIIFK